MEPKIFPDSKGRRLPFYAVFAKLLLGFAFLFVTQVHAQSSYCTSNLGGASYAWIDSVSIVNTTLQSSSGQASSYYNLFPTSGSTTTTLTIGQTYSIYVRTENSTGTSSGGIVSAWIDFDQDLTFSASEWVQINTSGYSASANITVPVSASPGNTRMRIRSRGVFNINGSGDACTSFGSGETEDYTITIMAATPCSGTPVGGTTTASTLAPCPGASVPLSVSGSSLNSGITYQWLQLVSGVWTPITGATSFNYSTPNLAGGTFSYRRRLVCTASGNFDTSSAVTLTVGATPLPYSEDFESITADNQLPNCMASTGVGNYYTFGNFNTYIADPGYPSGGDNHTAGGSKFASPAQGQNDASMFTPGITIQAGKMYQIKFWYKRGGPPYDPYNLDSVVLAYGSSQTAAGMTTNIATIVPPASAGANYTQSISNFVASANATVFFGIRYVSNYNNYDLNSLDDISIIELPPCSGTPVAGTIVSNPANPCLGKASILSLSGSSQNSGLAYQWQIYDPIAATWSNVAGATLDKYTTAPLTDSQKYRVIVTCTNSGGSSATTASFDVNPYSLTLPYTEDFEGITSDNELPTCWDATNLGGQTFTFTSPPSYPDGGQNHTPGGNNFGAFYYYYTNNWFFTPGVKLETGKTYQAKFWYATASSYSFNLLRLAYGNGQTPGAMINTVYTKSNINNSTYQQAKAKFSVTATDVYNLGLTVDPGGYPYAYLSFDDFNLIELPPCAGAPSIVMGQSDTVNICPDISAFTTLSGTAGDYSGFTYQWDSSTNGTVWFPITGEITEEHIAFSTDNFPKLYYRLRVTCTASGLSDTGNVVLNIKQPSYAALPYFNGFETWANSCDVTDVPSGDNWKQYWFTGNASWRREDQGASANWTYDYGAYYPDAQSGSHSARFNSYSALGYSPSLGYGEGQLDMYLDCSANTGSKGLYFYYINQPDNHADSLTIWYSIDGGLFFQQIAGWDDANASDWSRRMVNIPSNSPATIVSFRARKWDGYDYSDIGIDSVYVANPCTGTPTAGTVTISGGTAVCAGASPLLDLTGTSMAGNILVQWESSTTSGTAGFAAVSTPGTQYSFNTPPVSANTWFRARVTCGGSGLFAYSNVIAVTTSAVTYATLPFVENFESWSSRCGTSDIPSASWTNNPFDGDESWRRNDQGNTANWSGATSGGFFPAAAVGNYAARFHNYYTSNSSKLDLYVDCSGAGNKELRYYLNMSGRSTFYTNEYTRVSYSMDGGATFSVLGNFTSTQGWEQKKHVMPSTNAKTIVRFECFGNTYYQDMGIDYVEVLPPCAGKPVAGIIDSVRPCPGSPFQLKATGTSPAGGFTYQWQSTTAATATGFTNPVTGGTAALYNTAITQPTWYRLIVTCPGSNQSDTTAPFRAQIGSFYNCYCSALPYYPYQYNTALEESIGNVTLDTQPTGTVLINNGVGTPLTNNTTSTNPNNPGYSNFTNLPAAPLYLDSTYRITVQEVSAASYNNGGSAVAAWIDYNQDGTFDQVTERVILTSTSYSDYKATASFTIPATAKAGVTAMRVILAYNYGTTTAPNVCGIYNYYGETEDYLVEVRYHPCAGVVNAGVANASDLNTCPGYKVTLTDTSYEKKRYGLVRQWQQSTNGGASWTDIAGSQNRDTFKTLVTGPMMFRFALNCSVSGVYSYSNVLDVKMNQPYQCYCASYADGGTGEKADSSDVGSFSIGTYTFQVGGPHLQNPAATRERTDYTEDAGNVIELLADSAYKIDIYHIMKGRLHKDAKVTLFMDFNNDFQYSTSPAGSNYPSERVLTAFTSASDYYLDNLTITIPKGYVIPNVLTGMRLILNENVGASNASDEGCGVYTSGETEDYAVIFRDASAPQGVHGVSGNVKVLSLYPNPTSGVATLSYTSDVSVKELELTITNTTGQVISRKTYNSPGRSFTTDVNLSDQARGIYFVEIKADGERIIRKLVTQ